MKILTWNVWYKEDPEHVLKQLRELEWDVCCLQEIMVGFHEHVPDVAEYLAAELGVASEFTIAQDQRGKIQGNLILSRLPFTPIEPFYVQDMSSKDTINFDEEGRVVGGVRLDGSTLLSIFTTHLSYTHEFAESEPKQIECEKLLNFLTSQSGEFVFCGDLNVVPDSNLISALKSSYKKLSPDYTEPTWTTKPFEYHGFAVDTLSYRLDYMFGTAGVDLVSTEIIKTNYSDHLPILTRISLP